MTPLRESFLRELALRGMAARTVDSYVTAVSSLAKHYQRSPDRITDQEVQDYLLYLREEKHLAPGSINLNVSALRRFYDLVLQRPTDQLERLLPHVRGQTRRPQIFSRGELEQLFTVGCPEPKPRAFLMTVYGAGLRLHEACHLKVEHIDSARMQIRVELGKGAKDRYTLLPPRLLEELRAYYRAFRPVLWLFPAQRNPEQPLPDHSGQYMFWRAVERAGLRRKGGIHSLRHSFATHLLEAGVEITVVQRLLGHGSLSSTTTYLHVQEERLAQIQGPLQQLNLPPVNPPAPVTF